MGWSGRAPAPRVHTDEASNFKLLTEKYGYDHEAVDHSAKEYVRGDVHTNSIESFWSQVKRGINGTYVWVSKKHFSFTCASSSIAITCAVSLL
jgi:transposase